MAIKLADTLAPMADFPAAMAEHIEFDDGESLQQKLDSGSLGGDGAGYKQLSQAEYDALTDDEKMNGKEYRTYDTGHIYKLGIEYGKDTKLSQYGLVSNAPNFKIDLTKNNAYWYGMFTFSFVYGTTPCEIIVTITDEVYYTITKGQNLVSAITYTQDGANYTIGIDLTATIYGTQVVEMPIEFGVINSFTDEQFTGDTSVIFKGYESRIYTSLSQLGLDTTATINNIIGAMANGSQITYKTDVFDYATEYNNIQYGTVTIHKQSDGRVQVFMTDKDTGNLYVGRMDSSNKVIGWRNESFHRAVAQGTAGYFKFKPTSTGIDQPLRISVTDNYGGMINISGATPSASQYKPFKCIRLSYGEYSNYDAMKLANNKMLKLFYYNGYLYLKVTTYTTCTFTGLIETPTYVETLDETNAEEIPIRSVFDTPYHDGYADPSIICIGDTASSDGIIKTLSTLGFTEDVMSWDTGVYRVSHVGGLTNLPAEITEEKPGIRLEHYDMKKWGGNHNPNVSTYGCRQSVLHYKGNMFVRYTESGATANVLITDTGWKKIIVENSRTDPYSCTGYTVLTGTEDLFTLAPGHYASAKADTAYNYPITDSTNVLAHIYVLGHLNDPVNNKGYRIILYFDNKGRMYRINEWWGVFADNGWQEVTYKTYTTLAELGLGADATVENVIKALPIGGQAIISTHEFTNYQTLFPYNVEADKYATLKVEKGYDSTGSRTIVAWIRKDASRVVYGGLDATNTVKWWNEVSINGVGSKALVTNAQNFKLDITKKNANYYGFIKLAYLYGYHLCEVCIGVSSSLAYTVTKGKNLIDKITYTTNGANIIFGIDFTSKVYGVQVVEMPTDFGRINSLTAESFTGSTVINQTGLDLELYPQTKLVTSLNKGTWQVGQRIRQKTDFTANTNDANFEFVAKNESSTSTGKYQKMTIYQLTPIENGTNASTSYSVFEDGKAQVTLWPATQDMPRNDYNIVCEGYLKEYVDEYVDVSVAKKQNVYSTSEQIAGTWVDGKTIYKKTIKYTFSSNSTSGSNLLEIATISGLTHLISATGVYQRPGYTDFTIPYCKDNNNHMYVTCSTSNKKVFLNAANFTSGDIAYVTIEYIK